jgi:hypothetical protein
MHDLRPFRSFPLYITKTPAPHEQSAKTEPPHWYALPEWWLFMLGVPTLGVLCWQAQESRRAATAAKDAAYAALLNAKALIISERPWLLVSIQKSTTSADTWIVQARNAGRTPAELMEGHCLCAKHSVLFKEPSEVPNDPFPLPMQNLIVNEDSFKIREIMPETQITQADKDGQGIDPQSLFVYGWVSYWDTFTDREAAGAEPFLTRWIFRYDSASKQFFRVAGNYTKNT